ncbi:12056_t:CDS:2 [Ambispora leptoticha]|uniref:12056_t:CDS:1 n=1 Tax=Ambispora leptoticha TaxID=144679 RepID=A0A9N8Z884_9GLOM|nr:12056_t:CDS:2 [Ambispora leptoticha]
MGSTSSTDYKYSLYTVKNQEQEENNEVMNTVNVNGKEFEKKEKRELTGNNCEGRHEIDKSMSPITDVKLDSSDNGNNFIRIPSISMSSSLTPISSPPPPSTNIANTTPPTALSINRIPLPTPSSTPSSTTITRNHTNSNKQTMMMKPAEKDVEYFRETRKKLLLMERNFYHRREEYKTKKEILMMEAKASDSNKNMNDYLSEKNSRIRKKLKTHYSATPTLSSPLQCGAFISSSKDCFNKEAYFTPKIQQISSRSIATSSSISSNRSKLLQAPKSIFPNFSISKSSSNPFISNSSLTPKKPGGDSQSAVKSIKSDAKKRVAVAYNHHQQNYADFIPSFFSSTNNTNREPPRSKSSTFESKTSVITSSTNNKHIPFMEFADSISTTKQTPFTTSFSSSQQKLVSRETRIPTRKSNRTKKEPKSLTFPVTSSTREKGKITEHVNSVKHSYEVHATTVPPTQGKDIIVISDGSEEEDIPYKSSPVTATSNPEQNQQEQITDTSKWTSSATLLFEEENETENGGWDLGQEEIKEDKDLIQEGLDLEFNVEDDELDPWV